jgi:hypothetical protein
MLTLPFHRPYTDAYLTNGVFLYRVIRLAPAGANDFVELEDCYALDVVRVTMKDLRERRLRVVTPSSSDGRRHVGVMAAPLSSVSGEAHVGSLWPEGS